LETGGGQSDYLSPVTHEPPRPLLGSGPGLLARGLGSPSSHHATPRAYHVAAQVPGGQVLVAGGGPDLGHVLASAELWDPETRSFTPVPSMAAARRKGAAVALPDGRVLVVGGGGIGDSRELVPEAEVYDLVARRWAPAGRLLQGRNKIANAAALVAGKVLVAGDAPAVE
jgi:hypothetical protein